MPQCNRLLCQILKSLILSLKRDPSTCETLIERVFLPQWCQPPCQGSLQCSVYGCDLQSQAPEFHSYPLHPVPPVHIWEPGLYIQFVIPSYLNCSLHGQSFSQSSRCSTVMICLKLAMTTCCPSLVHWCSHDLPKSWIILIWWIRLYSNDHIVDPLILTLLIRQYSHGPSTNTQMVGPLILIWSIR